MLSDYLYLLPGILGIIGGLLKLIRASMSWLRQRASLDWVQTTGSITASITNKLPGFIISDLPYYYAEASYSYTVMGVEHQGKSKMDSILGLKSTAEKKALVYLPRAPLIVRYNPDKPEDSVSELDRISIYDVTEGFVLLALGIILLLFVIRFIL